MKKQDLTSSKQQPLGLPLALAVAIHLAVLLPTILAPHLGFWQRQRPPVDIQTVSLFSLADLAPTTPTAPGPPAPAPDPVPAPVDPEPIAPEPPEPVATVETPEALPETTPETPPPAEEAVVIAPESPPAEPAPAPAAEPRIIAPSEPVKVAARPAPPPEPISTRPIRTRDDEEQLQRLREAYQLEARAREAQQEAEAARRQAVDVVRDDIAARAQPRPEPQPPARPEPRPRETAPPTGATGPGTSQPTAGPRGGEVTVDAATREYLARLYQHIQAHWSLPNLPTWDENLLAVLIITIDRQGTVRDSSFEIRAENMYFNQLVRKTIEDAAPMPSFPPALRQNEMEIGLRFRPGEVY